ncbi:Hypp6868 [Branchiostoma lanceolatum]|uniref:Hypp6868 protein n=1 Tax=Branchiostoma lanceolatum TaxID=7740 RepID=A0A8K0EAR6_BRALA|nr:Hypp6868 [Branchiostoma lanceolatum]
MLNALLNMSINGPAVNSPEACTMLTHAVETWFSAKKRHGSKRLAEERRQQERMQKALIKLQQLYGEEEADVTMADPETEEGVEEAEIIKLNHLKVLEKKDAAAVAKAIMGETPPDSECDTSDSDADDSWK